MTFLVLSALLSVWCVIPYIRDILRGITKPNLVSWITWTLLAGIAAAAQISVGEYVAAIFTGAVAFSTGTVVLFGLRHGFVKYAQFDVTCQIAAVAGIVLWQLFDSPAIGVIGAVVIDFVGALPTVRHAWQKPGEETWQTFAYAGLGGLFAVLALETYSWITLPYAVYIVLINIVFVGVILKRRSDFA
jgi:hypothetical protein